MVGVLPPGLTGKCMWQSPGALHRPATFHRIISHLPSGVRMLYPIFRCGNWGARRRSLSCLGDPAKGRRRRGPTPGQPTAVSSLPQSRPWQGAGGASCQNPGRGVGLKQPPRDPRESNPRGFKEEAHIHPALLCAPDTLHPAPVQKCCLLATAHGPYQVCPRPAPRTC